MLVCEYYMNHIIYVRYLSYIYVPNWEVYIRIESI